MTRRSQKMGPQSIRVLKIANIVMLATIVVHDLDHVRQAVQWGYTFTFALLAVNCVVYAPNLVAFLLARQGRFSGAVWTCIGGLNTGISFAKIHLLGAAIPVWGPWNQSFFVLGADTLSWWVLTFTVVIGVGVALAGMYVVGGESARRPPAA